MYRQFLVLLGSYVFPLITMFAVAASLLEYVCIHATVDSTPQMLSVVAVGCHDDGGL